MNQIEEKYIKKHNDKQFKKTPALREMIQRSHKLNDITCDKCGLHFYGIRKKISYHVYICPKCKQKIRIDTGYRYNG